MIFPEMHIVSGFIEASIDISQDLEETRKSI